MTFRTALPRILMTGLLFLVGCKEDDVTAGRPRLERNDPKKMNGFILNATVSAIAPTGAHATPNEAFSELQAAIATTDYQRAAQTLTPQAQSAIAGALLFELGLAMANDDQQADRIDQLLAKHVAEESISSPTSQTANAAGTLRAMGNRVKNSPAFIAAAFQILADSPVKQMLPQGELQDVKIDDASAFAMIVQPASEQNEAPVAPTAQGENSQTESDTNSDPIEFQMIDGGWRVHLPDQMFEEIED